MASAIDDLGTRADFPITERVTYLDNAFIGPLPEPVYQAANAWLRRRVTEETNIYEMIDTVDRAREQFAGFIGAHADEIGFLYTTSEGENVVARALNLKPGDNIVTCDLAYPHTFVLGKHLEETTGAQFRVVKHVNGEIPVERFAEKIDRNTRLVMVPWVSNINALRLDVKSLSELAHANGAFLYADSIQLVGTQKLDVIAEDIDFLGCGGYKWLMAGWGIAPFYVRRSLLDRIKPDRYGWRTAIAATSEKWRLQHETTAAKFEYASPSFDQFFTFSAALSYLEGIGLERIHDHSRRLLAALRQGLEQADFSIFTPRGNDAPSLTFWVGMPEQIVEQRFRDNNIRIGFASGSRTHETYGENPVNCRVRISPAHYNNLEDIERVLRVCRELDPVCGGR